MMDSGPGETQHTYPRYDEARGAAAGVMAGVRNFAVAESMAIAKLVTVRHCLIYIYIAPLTSVQSYSISIKQSAVLRDRYFRRVYRGIQSAPILLCNRY